MKKAISILALIGCLFALYAGAQSNLYPVWGSGTSTITRTYSGIATWRWIIVAPDTEQVLVTVFGGGSSEVATDMPVDAGDVLSMPFLCTGMQIERAAATDGRDGYMPINK